MDEQFEQDEKAEYKAKRFKELGFHPQKEIPVNKLLPVSINGIGCHCTI